MAILIAMLSVSVSASALGLRLIQEFPGTPLASAKSWGIATSGEEWAFFATQDGLEEYDGSGVRTFSLNNHYSLRSVFLDHDKNRLYVGGINEFGYYLPSARSSLDYICLSDSVGDDRFIGNIWGVYPLKGSVVAQGDMNILIYDEESRSHSVINCPFKLDYSNMIDDVLWLGTDDGLKFLMGRKVVDASGADQLKGKRIRSILPFGEVFLIVTSDSGVFRYDRSVLTRLDAASRAAVALGEVFCADVKGNMLALGSIDNGVGIVDLTSGSTKLYNESTGLPNNTCLSMKFDDSGSLWTGLDVGIAKIQLTFPVETFTNKSLPIGSGYVLAVKDDRMYLGTNRGLFYVDYFPGTDLSGSTFRQVEGLKGQVWGLREINGDLFCCHDRGLFLVDGNKTRKIEGIKGAWDILPFKNDASRALVGTYFGFQTVRQSDGVWKYENIVSGYSGSCYNFVMESPKCIWTDDGEEGVYCVLFDEDAMRVEKLYNFKETSDGVPLTSGISVSRIDNDIYFATPKGIYRYDSKTSAIVPDERISVLLGSPGTVARVKKEGGWLYALTDKEIVKADPAGILGMKRLVLPGSGSKPMHDGDILFPLAPNYMAYPTLGGYAFFDFSDSEKDDISESRRPLPRINRVAVTSVSDSTVLQSNFLDKKEDIVVRYSENSIKIEFGSRIESSHGVVYCCRLNDDKWSAPVSSNMKEFTNLREGNYTFEVKAIAPDGMESVDSVSFKVLPPWWRTLWAMIFYFVASIFIVLCGVWLERRRVSRKQQALVREKDEELARRQADFEWESRMKDHKIVELEKEQLDKELRHKAQEMANVMMSLAHKNETLQTVKRELQNIQQTLPKGATESRRAIQDLQGKVLVDIKSDDVLKRVEEEFDLVHNDFIKKLRERYPDLSNSEVLMCAYLKMHLSTKEIAPLLNISIRGVETMRYRIRKKFCLGRDDSLTEFLEKN